MPEKKDKRDAYIGHILECEYSARRIVEKMGYTQKFELSDYEQGMLVTIQALAAPLHSMFKQWQDALEIRSDLQHNPADNVHDPQHESAVRGHHAEVERRERQYDKEQVGMVAVERSVGELANVVGKVRGTLAWKSNGEIDAQYRGKLNAAAMLATSLQTVLAEIEREHPSSKAIATAKQQEVIADEGVELMADIVGQIGKTLRWRAKGAPEHAGDLRDMAERADKLAGALALVGNDMAAPAEADCPDGDCVGDCDDEREIDTGKGMYIEVQSGGTVNILHGRDSDE